MPTFKPLFITLSIFLFSCNVQIPKNQLKVGETTNLNLLSEKLLNNVKNGEDVLDIQTRLVEVSDDELFKTLKTDEQKKAFWLNIYNSYIIIALKRDAREFENRAKFFTKHQVNIAGHLLSFDNIENGMLRKSQYKYGLGYVSKPLIGRFENKLRVDERDYRIHFALNCGAKSCPPVKVYSPLNVNQNLEVSSKKYIKEHSKYDSSKNIVTTTPLANWFKGDFGGEKGIIKILQNFAVLPNDVEPSVEYANYDWTLDINNFE